LINLKKAEVPSLRGSELKVLKEVEAYSALLFLVLLVIISYLADHALLGTFQVLALVGVDLALAAVAVVAFYLTADKA